MYKKIFKVIFSVSLLCFSFYYTKLAVDIVKNNNPIMKTIKKEKSKYEVSSVDAEVVDDTIIPGVVGLEVNVSKSFNKMFNYGEYHDSLYTFNEAKPAVSISQYYDKYINHGREELMEVALVFVVERDDDIIDLLTALSDDHIEATFFIDGLFIENNKNFVLNMIEEGYEVEVASYNGNYQELYFKTAVSFLDEIRGAKGSFCYSDYKKSKILNLCKKLELHTVIPSIHARTSPYQEIKNNLAGGSIIRMSNKIDELEVSVNYIKQRGYNLVRLDQLLSES